MAFRVNARNLSLTYPRCDIPKEEVLTLLQKTNFGDFTKYAIAQEHHQDQGLHLHIYLGYSVKKNLTIATCLDLTWRGLIYHPNIQATRNVTQWLDYLKKEDPDVLTNVQRNNFWQDAISATTEEEARQIISKEAPKEYVKSFTSIDAFCRSKKRKTISFLSKWTPQDFIFIEEIQEWFDQTTQNLDRCTLLVIIGKPLIGKTALIRSFGPHVYMRGMWALEALLDAPEDAKYVVLDDVQLERTFLVSMRPILLGMEGGSWLTDKYKKKTHVDTQGKPCVLISNEAKYLEWFSGEMWEECVVKLVLDKPLFNKQ